MSNVNTYRVIDFIMPFLPEPVGDSMVLAQRHLNELVAAYDALAPDWSNAPEWAQWYVLDADEEAKWYAKEPAYDSDGWHVIGVTNVSYCEAGNIPLGIDWRLCKWQRPEVTA